MRGQQWQLIRDRISGRKDRKSQIGFGRCFLDIHRKAFVFAAECKKTLQDIPVCCCRQPAVFAEPVDIPQDVFPGNVFGRTLRQKAADDLQVVSGGCFCKPAQGDTCLLSGHSASISSLSKALIRLRCLSLPGLSGAQAGHSVPMCSQKMRWRHCSRRQNSMNPQSAASPRRTFRTVCAVSWRCCIVPGCGRAKFPVFWHLRLTLITGLSISTMQRMITVGLLQCPLLLWMSAGIIPGSLAGTVHPACIISTQGRN